MKTIKIDKGIPIPGFAKDKAHRYPWKELEIGDSFVIEAVLPTSVYTAKSVTQRRTGREFTIRKLRWRESGFADFRIWRIG